ncbi:unnamed protein product [Moneuplotes crassus]|uniref:Uncharacterized protein n=1 Tax=Euplotes crassus TaxID=5936 RepID=A0AAD1Y8K8_EUPCR|nr:unnamed protein product [Moneuplotes crassus]
MKRVVKNANEEDSHKNLGAHLNKSEEILKQDYSKDLQQDWAESYELQSIDEENGDNRVQEEFKEIPQHMQKEKFQNGERENKKLGKQKSSNRYSIEKKFVEKEIDHPEYKVEFHFWIFVKIFVYQFTFFCTGIFTALFVTIVEGYHFAENMLFIGCKSIFGLLDYLTTVSFISLVAVFFCFDTEVYETHEIMFPIITIATRSAIIAIRYAYMSPKRYHLMKLQQTFGWLKVDLILLAWMTISLDALKAEIEATRHRIKYEHEDFVFTFTEHLSDECHEILSNSYHYSQGGLSMEDIIKSKKQQLKTINTRQNGRFTKVPGLKHIIKKGKVVSKKAVKVHEDRPTLSKKPNNNKDSTLIEVNDQQLEDVDIHSDRAITPAANRKYSGEALFKEITILNQIETGHSSASLVITIGRILLYCIIQGINYNKYSDYKVSDAYIFVSLIFMIFTLHKINLDFIVFGLVDFKRKLHFQKVMNDLLDPQRDNKSTAFTNFIPNIDVLEPDNLRAWLDLRKCTLDFGTKFTLRVFMYTSMFIVLYGALALYMTLNFAGVLSNRISLSAILLGYYDLFAICGVLAYMVKIGADVNSYFGTHKSTLLQLKSNLIKVKWNFEKLSHRRKFNSKSLESLVQGFTKLNMDTTDRMERCDQCIEVIEYNIEMLDHDSEHSSLRILGIKCSYELMNSIYTAIVSVGFAAGQYFYNNK